MSAILRMLACLLGVTSPSLMVCPRTVDRSWLDRWERRIQDKHRAAAAKMPPLEWRDEVQIIGRFTGTIGKVIDVTGRSDRAQRRVRNRWRRRVGHQGYDVRIVEVVREAST